MERMSIDGVEDELAVARRRIDRGKEKLGADLHGEKLFSCSVEESIWPRGRGNCLRITSFGG